MTDTLLLPVAARLLSCLCAALTTNATVDFPAPLICCLRAGEGVALNIDDTGANDECCQGLAYVRIDNFYPTGGAAAPFPSPSSDFALDACAPYAWGLQMEMGVYRCVGGVGDCAQWTDWAQRQMLDAKSMRQALCCFMEPMDAGDVSVTPWQAKGPEGGCLGGTMNVTALVINCGEC